MGKSTLKARGPELESQRPCNKLSVTEHPSDSNTEGKAEPGVLCQQTRLQRQASGLVKAQAKGSKAESHGEKTPGISLASIGAQTDADMQLSLHQTHTNNTHGKNNFLY